MDRDAAAFQRFDRQQAVVDRAEAGAGADDHRNLPACEKIGIKKGAGDRDEHAARAFDQDVAGGWGQAFDVRSEEHTSELQSLMRTSYAVFCLTKKKNTTTYRSKHK